MTKNLPQTLGEEPKRSSRWETDETLAIPDSTANKLLSLGPRYRFYKQEVRSGTPGMGFVGASKQRFSCSHCQRAGGEVKATAGQPLSWG